MIDIARLLVSSSKFSGFTSPTDIAGRLVLHDMTFEKALSFYLKNADIEFGARTDGEPLGFPQNVTVYQTSASDTVILSVADGYEASVPSFTNALGTVTKRGAGLLVVSVSDTTAMTGLVIEQGTLDLGEADLDVGALTVRSGATLKTKGTIRVTGTKTVEAGATVEGDVVAVVRRSLGGGPLVLGRPKNVVTMPGNPAFWVNTDDVDTDFEYAVEGGVTNVTRWNDCRGTAASGYNFATNIVLCPQLETFPVGVSANASGASQTTAPALVIAPTGGSASNEHGLLWARPENVRSLFLVMNPGQQVVYDNDGGGCLLGSTAQPNPWGRSNKPLFESGFVANAIKEGEIVVNGQPVAWNYELRYQFSQTDAGGEMLPVIIEVHTKDVGVLANAFGVNGARYDLAGGQRIFECVVYTNELTYAERMQACEYLGAKWMSAGANAGYVKEGNRVANAAADGSECAVDSGALDVGKLTGTGTFVKSGAGELLVEDCVVPAAKISARGGRLVIKSYLPSRNCLPYDSAVHLHIDADDTASITFKDIAEKGRCVSSMNSVRGDASVAATALTNSPLLRYSAGGAGELLAGKPYVDMGEYRIGTDFGADTIDNGSAEILLFAESHQIRSIFMVMGSHRGGGNPIGWKGKWDNYWFAGFDRWHEDESKLAVASTPICSARGSALPRTAKNAAYGVTRLNGKTVSPSETGYSGKFDIVSHTFLCDRVSTSAFACEHYNSWVGGLELSEAILSTKWHSSEETRLVEAYLRRKWFGATTEGFRQAEIGTLEVRDGAIVEVLGNAPVKVGRVVGGGTLNCAVEFADGAAVSVKSANGSVTPVTLSNASGLENGGTITVDGDRLPPGVYSLLVADGIRAGQNWSVVGSALSGRYVYTAVVRDGEVLLQVTKRGMAIIIR